jgi:hypothetical protein
MNVFKFKCNKCKDNSQASNAIAVFKEGCFFCGSKSITMLGYGAEE